MKKRTLGTRLAGILLSTCLIVSTLGSGSAFASEVQNVGAAVEGADMELRDSLSAKSQSVTFEDDFEAYEDGTVSAEDLKDGYVETAGAQIVTQEDGNKALAIGDGNVRFETGTVDKELQFDFHYNKPYRQWGGIYTKIYKSDIKAEEYYFSINPNFSSTMIISSGLDNLKYDSSLAYHENVWYTCKSRLMGTEISVKVWERGTEEPGDWSVTYDNTGFTSKQENTLAELQIDPRNAGNETLIDNVTVKTLDETGRLSVNVESSDTSMGSVTGGGTFAPDAEITVKAAALPGYRFVNWTENGVEVSKDRDYKFTVTMPRSLTAHFAVLGEPEYTYFEDDYENYNLGPATKDNMPPKYIEINDGYSIAEKDGQKVLQAQAKNGMSQFCLDCDLIDKQVQFDFNFSGDFISHDGFFVKLHSQPNGNGSADEYYFSINPSFAPKNMIVSCNTTNLGSKEEHFEQNTWYTCKSRIVENQIFLKIWNREETEPADWNFAYPLKGFVPTAKNTIFKFEYVDRSNSILSYIDNVTVKTWDPLPEKPEYTIHTKVNDESMGSASGGGSYLEGNKLTVKAKANKNYRFVNWILDGREVSREMNYTFVVSENADLQANFEAMTLEIQSFMANGLTKLAQIDKEAKTVTLQFASDVDLKEVRPYFYYEVGFEPSVQPYEVMDLSSGKVEFDEWTILASQNSVMKQLFVDGQKGLDTNEGTTPLKAFKTIKRAQEVVRSIPEDWTGDVLVNIAEGDYILEETLTFTPEDSAEKGYSVIYKGRDPESTTISSGVKLTDWELSDDVPGVNGVYEVAVPKLPEGIDYSRDLFVDGKRADLAKGSDGSEMAKDQPSYGSYTATGAKKNMYQWRNQSDIEFVYEVGWCCLILPVASIDKAGDASIINMKADPYKNSQVKLNCNPNKPTFIQNAFELLDEKNEWYFDRDAQKIYYIPEEGADLKNLDIVMPTLEKLVEVNGEPADPKNNVKSNPVYGLAFENIGFRYTSFLRPHIEGQIELQANFVYDTDMDAKQDHDNYVKTPGGLTAGYVEGMRIDSCNFTTMSAGGFDYEEGAVGSTITGSKFEQIGAAGIQIGGVRVRDAQPYSTTTYVKGVLKEDVLPDPDRITEDILVFSNVIDNVGVNFKGSVGVFAGFVRDFTLAHNTIKNVAYSGVSAGWGWGMWDKGGREYNYYKFDTPTVQERYVFENNNISSCMQRLNDGGAIYTLSDMPGSIINGNFIHDIPNPYGAIYLDEATGGIKEIANNVVYDVYRPYFYHLVYNYAEREKEAKEAQHDNFFTSGKPVNPEDPTFKKIEENAGPIQKTVISEVDKKPLEDKIKEAKAIQKGNYTKESYDDLQKAILEAEQAMETVTTDEEVKTAVEALQQKINGLRLININTDIQAAEKVINMIHSIGTVTKESKITIEAARTAYQKLTPVQQGLVRNYQDLVNAERQLAKIQLGKVTVKAANTAPKTIVLSWNKISRAEGYVVMHKENGRWVDMAVLTNASSTTYRFKKAVNGKKEMFAVKAYTQVEGLRIYSDYSSISIKAAPTAPKVKASISKAVITISWNKVSKADGYTVSRKSGSTWKTVASLKANTLRFTDPKVSEGKKYSYRVRAYQKAGKNKVYGAYSNRIDIKAVSQPASTKVKVNSSKGNIKLSWNKVSKADGYVLYRKEGKGWKVVQNAKSKVLKFTDKKVKKGEKYSYRIKAYKDAGGLKVYGKYSPVVSVKVK